MIHQLSQQKALECLVDVEAVKAKIETIIDERQGLSEAINQISFVEQVFPSDANFILAKVDDADQRYKQLIDKKIVVRNRTNQPLCTNCLRFTVGTKTENEILINTLKALE